MGNPNPNPTFPARLSPVRIDHGHSKAGRSLGTKAVPFSCPVAMDMPHNAPFPSPRRWVNVPRSRVDSTYLPIETHKEHARPPA